MLYNNEYYNKNSKVIWYPDRSLKAYVCFRKTFELESDVERAIIKTFANSKYVLYINGEFVKRGIYPADEALQQFDKVDITGFLNSGKNVICYICAPSIMGDSGLFAEAEIELTSGGNVKIDADKSFKTNICKAYIPANVINACDYNEIFDAREYNDDWLKEDFDDGNWYDSIEKNIYSTALLNIAERKIKIKESNHKARAIVSAGSGNECSSEPNILRQIKTEIESVKAGTLYVIGTDCEIKPLDKGYFSYLLIDVEKIVTGFVKFDITGYSSDVIDVCFAKELKDGVPIIESVSRFILDDGNNIIETRFTENTFRYMFVIFRNYVRADKVNDVTVIMREPEIKINDAFDNEENKESLNQLFCGVTDYLHNPYKLQDFQSSIRVAKAICHCTDNSVYMEQVLVTFLNCQNVDGLIPEYSPALRKTYNAEDTLDLINEIYNYYNISKDKFFLLKVYNKVLFAWNWFLSYENDKCLLENVKYNDAHRLDIMVNLKYYRALKALKNISSMLAEKETYITVARKLAKMKKSIIKTFYNKELCCFTRFIDDEESVYISKNANAVAVNILFDKKAKLAARIIDKVFGGEDDNAHTLSSYYLGDFVSALKKQKMETLIEKETKDRNDYIANSYYIQYK